MVWRSWMAVEASWRARREAVPAARYSLSMRLGGQWKPASQTRRASSDRAHRTRPNSKSALYPESLETEHARFTMYRRISLRL